MSCACKKPGTTCQCTAEKVSIPWKRIISAAVVAVSAAVFPFPPGVQIFLYVLAYIICGAEVFFRALHNMLEKDFFDENLLMTIATVGAFCIGEYPEGVAVMLFYQVGEALQERAAGRAREGIIRLVSLRPTFARVLENGTEINKAPEQVHVGELIRVYPGERVPLDGQIKQGNGWVDLSVLTGESVPVEKQPEEEIFAGSICVNTSFTIQVTKSYQESAIAKILEITEQAAEKKSSTEKFITRFARIYTPTVVSLALVVAVLPPLLLGQEFSVWISRALVFLVVSCPCALVLSVPLGFFGGLGGLARHGILVKGSSFLEQLSRIDTLAFDKTGTLTCGQLKVLSILPQPGFTAQQVLYYAASAEQFSNHPVAKTILQETAGSALEPVISHQEIAGEGIEATTAQGILLSGNERLMKRYQIALPEKRPEGTCLYVSYQGNMIGMVVLGDTLKPEAVRAVKTLQNGLVKRLVILSGDQPDAVKKIAAQVRIKEFYGNLLPADKVTRLEMLIRQTKPGRTTAFAGDGINDAPVLARADVSIAMGGLGTDAAIETADVVLMTDELHKIAFGIEGARFTLHIVKQNIGLALGVKSIVLVLSMVGLAHLWMAVFADVGVALIAVANALRPLYYTPNN